MLGTAHIMRERKPVCLILLAVLLIRSILLSCKSCGPCGPLNLSPHPVLRSALRPALLSTVRTWQHIWKEHFFLTAWAYVFLSSDWKKLIIVSRKRLP